MSITMSCPACQTLIKVSDQAVGRRAKCKTCGEIFTIAGAGKIATGLPPRVSVATPPPLPPRGARAFEEQFQPSNSAANRDQKILLFVGVGVAALLLISFATIYLMNRPPSESAPTGLASGSQASPSFGSPDSGSPDSGSNDAQPFQPTSSRPPAAPVISFSELPTPQRIAPGILMYPILIDGHGPGLPMQAKLYLPTGRRNPASLPCVFIAPAGTLGIHGSSLGDGDSPEHLPYVQAGFAVLAYELSGKLPGDSHEGITLGQLKTPVKQFMDADGGLANARNAVAFVLAKVPQVDPAQLFAAGHSSAARMALNVVASDHRFRAVAAYAPACDLVSRLSGQMQTLDRLVPGTSEFASRSSPLLHVNDITCPVLLFHADDDSNVPTADNQAYADALQAAGKSVQFTRVSSGGHYESMIDEGIPAGIAFFKSHGAKPMRPGRERN